MSGDARADSREWYTVWVRAVWPGGILIEPSGEAPNAPDSWIHVHKRRIKLVLAFSSFLVIILSWLQKGKYILQFHSCVINKFNWFQLQNLSVELFIGSDQCNTIPVCDTFAPRDACWTKAEDSWMITQFTAGIFSKFYEETSFFFSDWDTLY